VLRLFVEPLRFKPPNIMCVIIVKKRGVQMPTDETLYKAYLANHDGCGFVSERRFYKSLSFNMFLKHLKEVGEDENCIIHFRLATNGSVCDRNCHPFRRGDLFFAHNGIANIFVRNDMTDSETLLNDAIYPAFMRYGYHSQKFDNSVRSVLGCSKFALMNKGEIKLYGHYQLLDGLYFSNLRWFYCTRKLLC